MNKIKLLSFFGCDISIEVPEELKDQDWPKMFEDYFEGEKRRAVVEAMTRYKI